MLLPFQGVPTSSAYKPRVSLRSALGYVLVALSGRSFRVVVICHADASGSVGVSPAASVESN